MRFLPFYLVISGLFCIFALTNFINMVYYRHLFNNDWGLSPNEGLVYSALLSHSLMTSEHFNVDGSFSKENAKAFIMSNMEDKGLECIEYRPVSTRKIAKLLKMSENTVREIKNDLESKYHLIGTTLIICPIELIDEGYIEFSPDINLKGLQLIFYGLLKDRSHSFHGVIDTWVSRLTEILGKDKEKDRKKVYDLIYELHKKGYVERLPDGRLKIK